MRALICIAMFWLALASSGQAQNPSHFTGLDRFERFQRTTNENGGVTLLSPWIAQPRPWNELVLSWNASCRESAELVVEARAGSNNLVTPFYVMGRWSGGAAGPSRTSVRGQKDALAEVKTDTLICRSLMNRAQVRITLGGRGALPALKFLGISTLDTSVAPSEAASQHKAWGKVLEVPRRSQLGHDGASGWCSPTAISMVLGHWSKKLRRPELDLDVPTVARGVQDPAWEGTGNWSFNMAFAGGFEGMRALVTRLSGVKEIEEWVAAGVPVATSVSFDLLNGKAADEGNGHLIVVVGFTPTGDVVANDPWPNPKGENSVRRIFPRGNFLKAWQRSHRTVYLVFPLSWKLPADPLQHWGGKRARQRG